MLLDRVSVLLVEDHGPMRQLVRSLLRAFGFRAVYDAQDPTDALVILRQTPIDLIITDYAMQPLNGVEFVRKIRLSEDSPCPTVPIIMMTAHADARRVTEARDAGVNSVLVKPMAARTLLEHLEAALIDDRPFVRTPTYFGPQRRDAQSVQGLLIDDGPRRRCDDLSCEPETRRQG